MTHYDKLKNKVKQIANLRNASSVLHWDQETYMPSQSYLSRGEQLAALNGLAHELFVSKELEDILYQFSNENGLDYLQKINVTKLKKDLEREKKYSTDFVMEMTKTVNETSQQWGISKKNKDYKSYIPALKKLIKLKREEAHLLGCVEQPYNALLDTFEEGNKYEDLKKLFNSLKMEIVPLIQKIVSKSKINSSFLLQYFPKRRQWEFGMDVLTKMNFDFNKGRQDISLHPFTTSFTPDDVRITTRINPNNFKEMLWSTIHEGGHGLYEQGLKYEDYGFPSGEACSLAIHESQSRLWENNVGRGFSFWKYYYPKLQKYFKKGLKDINLNQWYQGINTIEPSLIRTNADELTYHFHIIIRFEIEKMLLDGSLEVEDAKEVWNSKYKEYLGLEIPDDAQGILQDVHWSQGLIGYFPTYTQGSLFAAQFFHFAKKINSSLENEISKGNLMPLLQILRENIHKHGRIFNSDELSKNFTGEPLNPSYFISYVKEKYSEIYNL